VFIHFSLNNILFTSCDACIRNLNSN